MGSLAAQVAVVTGSMRGMSKGIALALVERGVAVCVTGRTATKGSCPLPGNDGETIAECDARGAKCVAVEIDHAAPVPHERNSLRMA